MVTSAFSPSAARSATATYFLFGLTAIAVIPSVFSVPAMNFCALLLGVEDRCCGPVEHRLLVEVPHVAAHVRLQAEDVARDHLREGAHRAELREEAPPRRAAPPRATDFERSIEVRATRLHAGTRTRPLC